MATPAPNRVFTSVTPVNYQRNSVSGLNDLRQRQQNILENERGNTSAVRAALAQKQYNDQIARQAEEQRQLLAQQQAYSNTLKEGDYGAWAAQAGQQAGNVSTGNFAGPSGPAAGQSMKGVQLQGKGGQAVKIAQQYLGMPYQWGGSNPRTSFDCSGLTQYVYKQLGINLPRVSNAQAISGQRTSINNLRPGDLVAWDRVARNGRGARGADHIALYAGNGWIIEAAKKGTNVRYRQLSSSGSDASAWGVRLSY